MNSKMQYKIVQTDSYLKIATKFFKKHPDLLDKYSKTVTLLEVNPFHPSLRLHKLQGKQREYHSVSIDINYRIIIEFIVKDSEIIPINIGSHEEVYR